MGPAFEFENSRSEIRNDDVICERVLEPCKFFLKKVLSWESNSGHYTYHYTKLLAY